MKKDELEKAIEKGRKKGIVLDAVYSEICRAWVLVVGKEE